MNTERAILKGHLSELKMIKMDLETRIAANIRAVQTMLAGASVRPIAEIDIEAAQFNIQEAARQKKELIETLDKIRAIEKELA